MANGSTLRDGFAALADPTRRAIFERIAAQPAAVGELARGLPISRPAVSQHLRVLKDARLVTEHAEGTRRIYRVDPRGIGVMRDWLDARWGAALGAFKAFADRRVTEEDQGMSIAPVVQSVEVKAPPPRAFELFSGHIGEWWPKRMTPGKHPEAVVMIEPHAGGRWLERDPDGRERRWGKVLAWEPPARLLLGWQLDARWQYDADLLLEVELTFIALPGGGTRVTLEHRNLERFGADAARHADALRGGWGDRLANFAAFAESQI